MKIIFWSEQIKRLLHQNSNVFFKSVDIG